MRAGDKLGPPPSPPTIYSNPGEAGSALEPLLTQLETIFRNFSSIIITTDRQQVTSFISPYFYFGKFIFFFVVCSFLQYIIRILNELKEKLRIFQNKCVSL